jgi:AcrR family transcriptional regulator
MTEATEVPTTAPAPVTTRDQIIQAAADSLLENGYSGTSVRAIASRAGVAIGNLQYDIQLAAFDLLVQAPRTERLRAYLPELFTRYREVIQEQLDRLEEGGVIRLTVPRDVLVPLVLNTVLGFGLYYVVTRDDESCLRALSAFRQLASTLIEPVP